MSAQTVLQFPRVISQGEVFTGIAVGNPTTAAASVTYTAYLPDGTMLVSAKNPTTVTIPAAGQVVRLFPELFGVDTFNGWVQATSSTAGLTGFFLNGNFSQTDLDGAGSVAASSDILLPLVAENSITRTEITIVNVNPEATSATATLYSQSGAVLHTKQVSLSARGLMRQTLSGLFSATDFSAASHIRVRAERPVIAHEVVADFVVPGTTQARETAALTGHDPSPATEYVLPYYVNGDGWMSMIGLVNGSGISQEVTLTVYKSDGTLSTATTNPKRVTLEGNGSLRATVAELFGLPSSPFTNGWIKVSSTLGFVTSYIGYGNVSAPSFALVEGTPAGNATRSAVFSQVAEGKGFFTGLTVVNPGTESADVEFYTLRKDGSTVGRHTFTVRPNEHYVRLFRELLPITFGQTDGWGYLRSSKPVVGAVLFGTTNGLALANVPQQLPAGDFLPPAQTSAAITGFVRTSVNGQLIGQAGWDVQLKGPINTTTVTDADGRYLFPLLPPGQYTITPTKGNIPVAPTERAVTLAATNVDGVNFEAAPEGDVAPPKTPVISFATPTAAFAGTSAFTMRVFGSEFTQFSKVLVNDQLMPTTYVSSLELTAVVSASLLAQPGNLRVVVQTLPPTGPKSTALTFAVNNVPDSPLILGRVTVGDFPAGVAFDPTREQALVTNESSDNVSFIDTVKLQFIENVSVGRSPAEGIAIHGPKSLAVVANAGASSVSIIDLKTKAVQNVTVGKFPIGVAINPDTPFAYVVNKDDNSMSIVNLDFPNTPPVTVQNVGQQPSGIALNPRTNQALITSRTGNSVSLFNLSTQALVATISVGRSPRGVAWDDELNIAVTANAQENTISIINMATRQVTATVEVGGAPTGVAIDPATSNVLVTNSRVTPTTPNGEGLSTVTVYNLIDNEELTTFAVGQGAFGIAVNPEKQVAVVANFFGKDAAIIRIPNPRPRITDIEPKTFPVGGGSFTITVKGTGFVPTSVITLNGQALPTVYVSPTELRGTVSGALLDTLLGVSSIEAGGGGSKGTVLRASAPQFNVGVSNPCPPCGDDGGSSPQNNNNPNTQIIPTNPTPALLSLSPTEIVVGNTLILTLNGSGLNTTSVINFGGLPLTPDTASVNALTVTIPASQLTAGEVPVSVTNPSPGGGTTQVLTFTVIAQPNPSPAVTDVSPSSVNAGVGGVTIVVTGTGFISSTTASLNGIAGSVNGNTITFALPASMTLNPGTLIGSISNPTPGGGSATFPVNIVSVAPTITDFDPKSANAGALATVITVTGTNFRNGTLITVADTPIPTTFVSSTEIRGTIPETYLRRAGEFRIGVISPPPGGGSAVAGLFSINSLSPTLISVTPPRAIRQTTALTVQLLGTGFSATSEVFIGTTRLEAFFISSTLMNATIPALLMNTPGPLSITVTNAPPGGGTSLPVIFTVDNITPVVETVTPPIITGDRTDAVLTVTGRNFVEGATVRFGERNLVTTFVSSTQLTAPLPPPLAYGVHLITVVNPAPSTTSNGISIEITALRPVIDSIGPAPVRPGGLIRVTGRNFGPNSVILFLGAVAFPTTYVSTTELTGVLPLSAPVGPVTMSVVNPAAVVGATPLLSEPFNLTIVSPTPVIEVVSPTNAFEGETVTITVGGTNFFEGAVVNLGATPLPTTFVSFNELQATVTLGGPQTVSVRVQNPGNFFSNSVPFQTKSLVAPVLNPAPTITSIFPAGALINSETLSITLQGTGFFNLTTVSFGGTPLTITARTGTSITATVPQSLMQTGGTRPVIVMNPPPGGGRATTSFQINTVQLSPVSAEKIPGGTQQFTLINPPSGDFIWRVFNIDGGNSTYGTISSSGLYTAPSAVPSPSTFPVCARLSTNAAVTACAQVTISPTPTAGNDLVVFNDVNPFDNSGMSDANNRLMARNLVNFTGVGPRASGTVVQFDCGRNSAYAICNDATTMKGEITGLGLTVTTVNSSSAARITSIPANVKALFLWLPTVEFNIAEINTLKNFAQNGGRIVFVGEHAGFYGSYIPLQNDFLQKMGAVMQNIGEVVTSGYTVMPSTSLRPHQITEGMTQVNIAASSVITLGPNDFPLYYDQSNTKVLSGVAKIDTTPLPTTIPLITSILPDSGRILASTNVVINGTGFIKGITPTSGTTIATSSSAISVTNIVVVNSTTINATFTPAFNTPTGPKPVTATTQNGLGGGVSWTVSPANPPTITSLSIAAGVRNSSVTVTVNGSNFTTPGTTASITGTGVTLGAPNVTSATSMTVQFTISSDPNIATIGPRNFQVTTAGGVSNQTTFTIVESSNFTGFTKTWVGGAAGAVDNWTTGANWQPVGMPGSLDSVFVPGGLPNNPVIGSVTPAIKDLYLAPGATLSISNTFGLVATGHVFAGSTITGPGTLMMSGAGKSLQGTVSNLSVNGTVSSSGNVNVTGNMVVFNGGNYTANGKTLDVGGSFSLADTATFTMMNPNDLVRITGLTSFTGGSTAGKLTQGVLEVKGGFVQAGGSVTSFSADPGHKTRFVGSSPQSIVFASTTSHFGRVEISNTAGGGVSITSGFTVNAVGDLELKTATAKLSGTVPFITSGNLPRLTTGAQITINDLTVGGNVDARDPIGAGATTLRMNGTAKEFEGTIDGHLVVTGTVKAKSHPTTITRNLMINTGGQFDVNGMVIGVTQDVTTSGTGTLKMANSNDRLDVARDAIFDGGSTDGLIAGGVLTIGRHFKAGNLGGSLASFAAGPSHVTKFTGIVTQDVVMDSPGAFQSHFGTVEIANPTSAGSVSVAAGKNALATGSLKLVTPTAKLAGAGTFTSTADFQPPTPGSVISIANLSLGRFVDFGPSPGVGDGNNTVTVTGSGRTMVGYVNGSLVITGNPLVTGAMTVTKNVTVAGSGVLAMGNFVFDVGQDFKTIDSGILSMPSENTTLNVAGNVEFSGGSTNGYLTSGTINLKKNFKQLTGGSGTHLSFVASGAHKVKFSGTSLQNLEMAWPGASESHFQNVEIATTGTGVLVAAGNLPLALGNLMLSGTGVLSGGDAASVFTANGGFTATGGSNNEVNVKLVLGATSGAIIDTSTGVRMNNIVTLKGGSLKGSFLNDLNIDGNVLLNGNVGVLDSSLSVAHGTLDVQGFNVSVVRTQGESTPAHFYTAIGGILDMNDGGNLTVAGNVTFSGASTAGKLNAGVITVGGNFTQNASGGSSSSFSPGTDNIVKFNGSSTQNVQFSDSGEGASHFNDFEVANSGGGEGVKILSASVDLFALRNVRFSGATPKLTLDKTLTYYGTLFSVESQTIVNRENLIDGNENFNE